MCVNISISFGGPGSATVTHLASHLANLTVKFTPTSHQQSRRKMHLSTSVGRATSNWTWQCKTRYVRSVVKPKINPKDNVMVRSLKQGVKNTMLCTNKQV